VANARKLDLEFWLKRCECLIVKHSTAPRVRGKYKGHSSTDAAAWVRDLTDEVQAWIRRTRPGIAYDENMALASTLGLILSTWYALVHRAKTYDPNRPLKLRRKANRIVTDFRAELVRAVCNDALMGKVWSGQTFAPPYGKAAKGGKFV
jgi:hypothetical protein